jgi:hypothetical protein
MRKIYGLLAVCIAWTVAACVTLTTIRVVLTLYWTGRAANYVIWCSALASLFYVGAYSLPRAPLALASLTIPAVMLLPLAWFGPEPSLVYVLAFYVCGLFTWWQGCWFAGFASVITNSGMPGHCGT